MTEVQVPSNPPNPVTGHASDLTHVVLAFDDNRLIGDLYGEFDQNLAEIERRLKVTVIAHGNQVTVKGGHDACDRARQVLESLWERLQDGHEVHIGDVDGAIRMSEAEAEQLPLPTLEPKARFTPAQISTRRKTVSARTPAQDAYVRAMGRADLVFGIGPAGTGKTYLAVAYAAALIERGDVDRLILSRPAVEAGERLGFLPGDMKEKVDPYLRPLYDALYDMMPAEKVERGLQSGMIEVAPLAFMRGRTLSNAVVLLDEAQNCTTMQMKMFLTRLGENSRMIVTGDPTQVDLPPGVKSGLVDALEILADVEGMIRVNFTDKDVVRHELVARIVKAYDDVSRTRLADERDRRGEGRPR
ncbi:PhoH family protein [Siculibacillus lacustris]|uniref:PhoH family protein n=1 Tax=Siculibacillus lacustris TaxID=1549641 RepID=UPI001D17EE86|nr:PhoH family protein [Siculibacillus lacustris]